MARSAYRAVRALYPGSGLLRVALRAGDLRWDEGVPWAGRPCTVIPAAGPCATAEPFGTLPVHSGARSWDGRGVDPRTCRGGPEVGAVALRNFAVYTANRDRDRDLSGCASVEQLHLLRDPLPRRCVLQ